MSRQKLQFMGRLAAGFLLAGAMLINAGCLFVAAAGATGAGVATYAYCKGKVCEVYPASVNDTWAATRAALADLGMPVEKEEHKADGGSIASRTAQGERVHIDLESLPSKIPAEGQVTRVGVRVATFGDKVLSERILDQIGRHLAPPGATTAPLPPARASLGPIQPVTATAPAAAALTPQQSAPPPLASEPVRR